MPIKIDYKKCCWKDGRCSSSGCGCGSACMGCVKACPVGALSRKDKVIVDRKKCIEYGACVTTCKHNTISLD
jgi:uncharacterized Fe-S center protein